AEKCAEGSNLPVTPYRVNALPSRARRLWHRMLRNAAEVIVMASGGARNRSGPQADPNSGRSDRREYSLTALPSKGYDGPVPEFPLPGQSPREAEVWAQVWRTPQAAAWALPSEAWRQRTVALWVRTTVRCEDPDAGAALLGQLHRFSDQIGMTTAGLAEMGWKIANPEQPEPQQKPSASKPSAARARDRLKVVSGGG